VPVLLWPFDSATTVHSTLVLPIETITDRTRLSRNTACFQRDLMVTVLERFSSLHSLCFLQI
jgi:hypothetical protein